MTGGRDALAPGKHFPAELRAPSREEVLRELGRYGFFSDGEIRLADSSHDAEDIRLNYLIDGKWVLRLCRAPEMTEKRLEELNRLITRYRDFGLRCPLFLRDPRGRFFHERDGLQWYLAEYIDLKTADQCEIRDPDALWQEVFDSVARFAERYRDTDLIGTMGMYSLFDLNPFDKPYGIDEKQQNFDSLTGALRGGGHTELADRLERKHALLRGKLREVYRTLPRCVFQGDENLSNLLIDEDRHLAGLIDFNLAGTEVIVNQFANLGGGFEEDRKEPMGAGARLDSALRSYRRVQGRMLRLYHATETEKDALGWYTWIALTAGWPQVCFFLDALKGNVLKEEVLELLGLMADLPEEALRLREGEEEK